MEWVETTGKTIEEALDAALDELGVDQSDVEYDVLEEPKGGLFGRVRTEARIRARVKPTKPHAKEERRRRRPGEPTAEDGAPSPKDASVAAAPESVPQPSARRKPAAGKAPVKAASEDDPESGSSAGAPPKAAAAASSRTRAAANATSFSPANEEETGVIEVADEFLVGLVERFGLQATTQWKRINEDTLQVELVGQDLGLLIGPKAQTLFAIQDILRIIVHYELGERHGRLLLDVAGYRDRRREALERFARQIAAEVVASGERRALEPMVASDRKVVHDTCNSVDGVSTESEGEDPNRRVVILPAS